MIGEGAVEERMATIVAHDIGGPGGMERVLAELITGLLGAGYRLTIVSRTLRLPAHPQLAWVRVPGPSRPFPLAYPWFLLIGSLLTWRWRKGPLLTTGAIVLNRADWCAVHLCHRAARKVGLSRASRGTTIYRLNEVLSAWLGRIGEWLVYRPSRVGGAIGVSAGVSAEIAHYYPRLRRQTIPNGVSVERFRQDVSDRKRIRSELRIAPDEPVALFVGSEWRGKGLAAAIEALSEASGWKLLVVGRGDVDGYSEHATARGVADRVIFAGVASDPAPLYGASDAFVLPTSYETFSLVTYEAAATGLPLLVTPVNGVTDLLEDGVQGWFIAPEPHDIAEKLNALCANPDLRAAMGQAGRRTASAFTWPRMVSEYRALLES